MIRTQAYIEEARDSSATREKLLTNPLQLNREMKILWVN